MNLKPVKNEHDYKSALKRVDVLWEALPKTDEGDELEILSVLIENYEKDKYRMSPPSPIEAIKFRMEQLGLKKTDLAAYLGGRNRSTEILGRKRNLSVRMMRSLHKNLKIPAESLLS
jgi:HTH-type transcriptional regulator/antitoxin HigA